MQTQPVAADVQRGIGTDPDTDRRVCLLYSLHHPTARKLEAECISADQQFGRHLNLFVNEVYCSRLERRRGPKCSNGGSIYTDDESSHARIEAGVDAVAQPQRRL